MRPKAWQVALATLLAIGALDAARSYIARHGYDAPSELWKPTPKEFTPLTWSPGADLPPATPLGKRVYAQRCAICHGAEGRGNGPAAPSLHPQPRDFTAGVFKYQSTPQGSPPTDADLLRTVRQGLHASAMPAFGDLLHEDELKAVVETVKGFSTAFATPAPALASPPKPPRTAASIERGRVTYALMKCEACHGADGRSTKLLEDMKGQPIPSRDLTAPWTFRGGSEPEQLWLRLTTGSGTMPSYAAAASDDDRWALVDYLTSIARVPPWQPGGKLDGPGQSSDPLARGNYLVHFEMCGLCHTQIDATGIYRQDAYLAGGMRVGAYPHGTYVSYNLTSDVETGIGGWSEGQLISAFQNGRAPDHVLNPNLMVWIFFHAFSSQDAAAVATYLKSQPAVHNAIPPPLRYGFIETILAKLVLPLPAANPIALTYKEGNFGNRRDDPAGTQRDLIRLQWLVLALGLIAWFLSRPRERRWPRGARGWLLTVVSILGIGLLGSLGAALYDLPALSVIPPDQVAAGVTTSVWRPDLTRLPTPEQRAMVERGRYLFTVDSCVTCHGPDGSGGLKISWRAAGTFWSRNLTSDSETGLGAWTDDQVARALRSGISRDGRAIHWQAMIWDHVSNMDEEDVRSVIAYLRTLPPVHREVHPDAPPSPADCLTYTFFLRPDLHPTPGCSAPE